MIMIKIILALNDRWTMGPPLGWSFNLLFRETKSCMTCCYNEHVFVTQMYIQKHCTAVHVK